MKEVADRVDGMGKSHHEPGVQVSILLRKDSLLHQGLMSCSDESGADEGEVKVPVVLGESFGGDPSSSGSC